MKETLYKLIAVVTLIPLILTGLLMAVPPAAVAQEEGPNGFGCPPPPPPVLNWWATCTQGGANPSNTDGVEGDITYLWHISSEGGTYEIPGSFPISETLTLDWNPLPIGETSVYVGWSAPWGGGGEQWLLSCPKPTPPSLTVNVDCDGHSVVIEPKEWPERVEATVAFTITHTLGKLYDEVSVGIDPGQGAIGTAALWPELLYGDVTIQWATNASWVNQPLKGEWQGKCNAACNQCCFSCGLKPEPGLICWDTNDDPLIVGDDKVRHLDCPWEETCVCPTCLLLEVEVEDLMVQANITHSTPVRYIQIDWGDDTPPYEGTGTRGITHEYEEKGTYQITAMVVGAKDIPYTSKACEQEVKVEPPEEPQFVPEWGTLALLGGGLSGLAGYVKLRLRKR